MNGSGVVTSPVVVSPPRGLAGLQVTGARQFGMASPPRARQARKNEIEPRNEALRVSTEYLLLNVETERRRTEILWHERTILHLRLEKKQPGSFVHRGTWPGV
jgi:hypothetical protein